MSSLAVECARLLVVICHRFLGREGLAKGGGGGGGGRYGGGGGGVNKANAVNEEDSERHRSARPRYAA